MYLRSTCVAFQWPRTAGLGLVALFAACSAQSYIDDADREVATTLNEASEKTLGDRENWVVLPDIVAASVVVVPGTVDPGAEVGADGVTSDVTRGLELLESPEIVVPPEIDLAAALRLAVNHNREFMTRRESLYREGLAASLTRFQFGPQFQAAVTYLWPQSEGGFQSQRAGTSWSGSQILPTGGSLSVSAGFDGDWPGDRGGSRAPAFGTNIGMSLSQPLLRGFGYEVSHNALTQAERNLTYAIREFEQFRQSFTISVAQQFFQLLSQRETLANGDANYEAAVFDRKKAIALEQVGQGLEQDVFRARRREIEAKDQLINARASFERSVDEFKIQLGLPTKSHIKLADIEPPYEPVRFEVNSAIEATLHNRLDLITQRQSLEDTERSLRIAENNLLPDLNLVANYGFGGSGNQFSQAQPSDWNASIGLSFEIPLQRQPQRNSYRSSLIGLEQARRALKLREDQLTLDIRDAVRRLRSIEERIELQEAQILREKRVVTVTAIRLESGDVEGRELFDARQAYVTAQNALVGLKVDHFVARLNLLRDMGLFFVDRDGMWRPGPLRI